MNHEFEMPVYMKIAVDMASRIYNGEFEKEKKIRGRSTLASEYNVSPETIRRAMRLLEEMEVVIINQGSGIYVRSIENASAFIEQFENKVNLTTLRTHMNNLLEEKRVIEAQIEDNLRSILDFSSRMKHTGAIVPVEAAIPSGCHLIGKNTLTAGFWENTGGTIIGLKRNNHLIISPGPHAELHENDVMIIIGDSDVLGRVKRFIDQ